MRTVPLPVRCPPGLVLACLFACALGCAMDDSAEVPNLLGGPTDEACTVDQDCADPALYFCNTALSRCEAACRTDEDCSVKRRGELHAILACESQSLGCRCDASRCVPALCTGDDGCEPGKVCRNGTCGAPPAASKAASCHVVPERLVAPVGTTARFEAWLGDNTGQPIVLREGVTWKALTAQVTGEGTGPAVTFTLATVGAEAAAVEARLGAVICRANVTVLPRHVAVEQLRVLVTDALTGHPVPGASVLVSDGLGRTTASASTDAVGVAVLAAQGDVGVSVLHPDFGYVTLAHYSMEGTRDLRLPLRRNPADREGGVRGTFGNFAPVGAGDALALGFMGLSVPGLLSEAAPVQVLGPERQAVLGLGGMSRAFQVPTNVWLSGLGLPPQPVFTAPGIAGVCDENLVGVSEPEEAMRAGACGTRTAWALTTQVPSGELPAGMMDPGTDPLLLLARALPPSGRFSSALLRDVQFTLRPPNAGEAPRLTPVAYDFRQVPLAFPFVARVPALPRFRDRYLERTVVLGTVTAPGRGTVPLGLGAAVNANPSDPNTDLLPGLTAPGLVRLRMAPAHHGLEGQPYRLLALASSGALGGDVTPGTATSAVMADLDAPRFDPEGTRPVTFPTPFAGIPEGARYNPDVATWHGLLPREWRMDSQVPSATLVRATFTNAAGRRWTVWMDNRRAVLGVRLPVPPAGFEDRTFQGDTEGSRASLSVEALTVTTPEGGSIGGATLAESGGLSPESLAQATRAVSTLHYGRPQVSWIDPPEGASLPRGAPLRVRVDGFQVGSTVADEGGVLLEIRGGGPGCDDVVLRGDVATRSGEVAFALPVACSGVDVVLAASLVDGLGLPLRPAVTAVRTVQVP
ncbi:carboxypeptidase regulatory-like domain-containing protein [Corallococcus sp. CA053C]|uniref:carboxypeptidase regulatory-like domain-containing protein n=1 Tax=Corallococcus sp. CA053C TaxID=2316732 RepID=UPI000EA209EF|nr:carboxypeptidase regulatory-like domain-containing protein [Corallococcus sp. CA053C]RKH02356.1 carboxypeptidase regulatory-like domain-containing protein [Corallococcus sp. CA053C]